MKITRFFQATKQIRAYEPVVVSCQVEVEVENRATPEAIAEVSRTADEFCKDEVRKSLQAVLDKNDPKAQKGSKTPTYQKYWWGNQEPPKWIKSNKALQMWLFKSGYTNAYNDPEATQEDFHTSEEIAEARESRN